MSKTNTFETEFLQHILQNAGLPGIGDVTGLLGSAVAGSLHASLHSADPGEAGLQNTSEIVYTGYARVAVPRSALGWTVSGNNAFNAADINFPACTGGVATATHWGIGTAAAGAGKLLWKGPLSNAPFSIVNGVQPSIPAGDLDLFED